MIELFQKLGAWNENDAYVPKPGDVIFYDWQDSGSGDNTGWPDHVGIVEAVSGSTITVIEGNKSDSVSRRTLQVGGKYIRGYGVPKYAESPEDSKLVYGHRAILKPYLEGLKTSSSDDSLRRIQEIQTLLAQNTEKRETLTKLMTQGIIDPVLYNKETNGLLSQADSFRSEIEALKNEVSGDMTKVNETTALLHFSEKGGMLPDFDEELFDNHVRRIVIRSRHDICFELKCGLRLTERM